MNAKAALCLALLEGHVLNIKNCVKLVGLTNCSREIGRMVEKPFGVQVSRTPMKGMSRYKVSVTWVNYRLNHAEYNLPGIEKMKAYVREHMKTEPEPKTTAQQNQRRQINLFLETPR
jgi:hypothetical protein